MKAGRKAGTPNKSTNYRINHNSCKTETIKIRCTPEFKKYLNLLVEKDIKTTQSSALHACLKYYLTGSAWWLQGEAFKEMQNSL